LLKKAIGTLNDALDNQGKAFSSFVQTKKVALEEMAMLVETQIEKIATSPMYTSPLTYIFSQLS
jgi:hypothetical protein